MPDPADDRADFQAALRRAEEAAGISRDDDGNEHAAGETPVATPELPEAEPVQASDQPLTPETVVETDTSEQQPEVAPAEPKSAEELQAALAAAEARIAEQVNMIGRQTTEVGEVRQEMADLKARLDSLPTQPTEQQAPHVAITQELIDSNPAYAVQAAFAQKNEQALAVAFESWKIEDPFSAATWISERRLEQQQQAFDAKLTETRQQIDAATTPLVQTAAEATENAAWNEAFATTVGARPDFLEHAERLLSEVAPKFPHIVSVLSTGDAKGKAEVLTALYDLDRAQATDPAQVRGELERQAAEAAAEADAARQGAQVVSQTTVGQSGVEKTPEEEEQQAYHDRRDRKPSLSRGWTGR